MTKAVSLSNRFKRAAAVLALTAASLPGMGFAADDYPSRPIKLVVSYAAGGGNDITARMLAAEMSKHMGQSVVVENMPGASAMIATKYVVRAAPDGYTLLVTDSALATTPFLYKLGYDWKTDLTPISLLAKIPNVLTVNAALPIHNVTELIEYSKTHDLSYSSSGIGNANHLNGEMFNKMAGTKINHIPYKGTAPQLADTAAGHVSMTFGSIGASQPFIDTGKIRAIAVSSAERVSAMPQVPTIGETPILAGYDISNYFGFFGPANLPAPVLEKLSFAVQKYFLENPEIVKKLKGMGFEPQPNTPEQFRTFLNEESLKYGKIISEAGIKLESAQ